MNWKKTLLCTAVMLAAMPFAAGKPAYADEMDENSTFTITVNNTPQGHSYAAYRVFRARTDSDGTLSDISWGEGVSADAVVSGLTASTFPYRDKFASKTSASDIAKVINENQSDADFVREVSAVLVKCRAAKAADADPAGNVLQLTGAGWYLTLDETDLSGQNDARSAVLIFTSESSLTVDPKIDLPSFTKYIVSGGTEVKTEDVTAGDTVRYRLNCELPDNYKDYEQYELHFFDSSTGIRYETSSFSVAADGTELDVVPVISGNTMQIDIADLKTLTDKDLSGKNVTVEYSGTVTEEAVMGSAGNPNTSYITYSNDPYGTQKGRSAEDRAVFYTFKVEVDKVDEENHPLTGASFLLEKKNTSGSYTPVTDAVVSQDGTVFTFERIGSGEYRLSEQNVPSGYNKMEPMVFTVSSEHEGASGTFSLTALSCTEGEDTIEGSLSDGRIVLTAVNRKGVVLPSTGGTGTALLYGAGIAMLALSALIMQRKHEKE